LIWLLLTIGLVLI